MKKIVLLLTLSLFLISLIPIVLSAVEVEGDYVWDRSTTPILTNKPSPLPWAKFYPTDYVPIMKDAGESTFYTYTVNLGAGTKTATSKGTHPLDPAHSNYNDYNYIKDNSDNTIIIQGIGFTNLGFLTGSTAGSPDYIEWDYGFGNLPTGSYTFHTIAIDNYKNTLVYNLDFIIDITPPTVQPYIEPKTDGTAEENYNGYVFHSDDTATNILGLGETFKVKLKAFDLDGGETDFIDATDVIHADINISKGETEYYSHSIEQAPTNDIYEFSIPALDETGTFDINFKVYDTLSVPDSGIGNIYDSSTDGDFSVQFTIKDTLKPTMIWTLTEGATVKTDKPIITATLDGTGSDVDCSSIEVYVAGVKVVGVEAIPDNNGETVTLGNGDKVNCTQIDDSNKFTFAYTFENSLLFGGPTRNLKLKLEFSDTAGNSIETPSELNLNIDTNPPKLKFSEDGTSFYPAAANSYIEHEAYFSLEGNYILVKVVFDIPITIKDNQLTINKGSDLANSIVGISPNEKEYTFRLSSDTFSAGSYTLTMTLQDAGREPVYTVAFTIDNTFPTASIQIDSGATYTTDEDGEVTLTLSLTDDDGIDTFIIKSGDDTEPSWAGETEVVYTDQTTVEDYALTADEGTKYVWIKVKNKAGLESIVSDSIIWDKTLPKLPTATVSSTYIQTGQETTLELDYKTGNVYSNKNNLKDDIKLINIYIKDSDTWDVDWDDPVIIITEAEIDDLTTRKIEETLTSVNIGTNNYIFIEVVDDAGNKIHTTTPVFVAVDDEGPEIQINYFLNPITRKTRDGLPPLDISVEYSGSAVTQDGICLKVYDKTANDFIGDKKDGNDCLDDINYVPSPTYSLSYELKGIQSTVLYNGEYNVLINAKDTIGNPAFVRNGGFESVTSTTADGWTFTGSLAQSSAQKHSGSLGYRVNNGILNSNTFKTRHGQKYLVSYWAKLSTGGINTIKAKFNNLNGNENTLTSTSWARFEDVFEADSETTTLKLVVGNNPAIDIDDVEVYALTSFIIAEDVPENPSITINSGSEESDKPESNGDTDDYVKYISSDLTSISFKFSEDVEISEATLDGTNIIREGAEIDGNTLTYTNVGLGEKSYVFVVTAAKILEDEVPGNSYTWTVTVVVDKYDPTVTALDIDLRHPAGDMSTLIDAGTTIYVPQTFTISAVLADTEGTAKSGIDKCQYTIDNGGSWQDVAEEEYNELTGACTKEITLASSNSIGIKAIDKSGRSTESKVTVTLDLTAPATTPEITDKTHTTAVDVVEAEWYTKPDDGEVTLLLDTVTEAASGLDETKYCIVTEDDDCEEGSDGWIAYPATVGVQITTSGINEIKYYSVDNVGNVEDIDSNPQTFDPKEVTVKVDNEAPTVVDGSWSPDGTIKQKNPTITLIIDGTGSELDCSSNAPTMTITVTDSDHLLNEYGPLSYDQRYSIACEENSGAITFTPNGYDLVDNEDANAEITLSLTVHDKTGNDAIISHTFNINTLIPVVTLIGADIQEVKANQYRQLTLAQNYRRIKLQFNQDIANTPSITLTKTNEQPTKTINGAPSGTVNGFTYNLIEGGSTYYIEEGSYSLSIDADGTVNDISDFTFTIDNTAPIVDSFTVSNTHERESVTYIGDSTILTLQITDALSPIDLDSCKYTLDGTIWIDKTTPPPDGVTINVNNGANDKIGICTVTILSITVASSIQMKAKDKADNIIITDPQAVTLDTDAPILTIERKKASDDSDVSDIWVNYNLKGVINCEDTGSGCKADSYKYYWTINPDDVSDGCPDKGTITYQAYTVATPPEKAEYGYMCAYAEDNLGNSQYSDPVEFKIDKAPPTIVSGSWSPTGTISDLTPEISVQLLSNPSEHASDIDCSSIRIEAKLEGLENWKPIVEDGEIASGQTTHWAFECNNEKAPTITLRRLTDITYNDVNLIVKITIAKDEAGNDLTDQEHTIHIDQLQKSIYLLKDKADHVDITNGGSYNLEDYNGLELDFGTVPVGIDLSYITLTKSGSGVPTLTLIEDGASTQTKYIYSIISGGSPHVLDEGAYTLKFTATETETGAEHADIQIPFIIDTTPPTIDLGTSNIDGMYTDTGSGENFIPADIKITADVGDTLSAIKQDSCEYNLLYDPASPNGNWQSVDNAFVPISVKEGQCIFTIPPISSASKINIDVKDKAVDATGNNVNVGYLTTPIEVTLDITQPTFTLLRKKASDNSDVSDMWVNYDLKGVINCDDGAGSGCNAASYKYEVYDSDPGSSCPNDVNAYTETTPPTISFHKWVCAYGEDNVGNKVVTTSPVEFKVDKQIPSAANWKPAKGDTVNIRTPPIIIDLDDIGSGIDCNSLELTIFGNTYTTSTTPAITTTCSDGDTSSTISFEPEAGDTNFYMVSAETTMNNIGVELRFSDVATNPYTKTIKFHINTNAPEIRLGTLSSPIASGEHVKIETDSVNVQFESDMQSASLSLTRGGSPIVLSAYIQTRSSREYVFRKASGQFEDGIYTAQVTSVDMADNPYTYGQVTFTIDNGAPTVLNIAISPSHGSTYISGISTITADITDSLSTISSCSYQLESGGSWTDVTVTSGTCTAENVVTSSATSINVKAVDEVTNEGEGTTVSVTVDTTTPTTTATISAEGVSDEEIDETTWYKGTATVTLQAEDGSGSGVKETKYCIVSIGDDCTDKSTYTTYSTAISITHLGETILKFYSVDNVENEETIISKTIKYDNTIPTLVEGTWQPIGTIETPNPTITVTIDGTGSDLDCTDIQLLISADDPDVDANDYADQSYTDRGYSIDNCDGPTGVITFAPGAEDLIIGNSGTITLKLTVKDKAGNPATLSDYTFNINKFKPAIYLKSTIDEQEVQEGQSRQLTLANNYAQLKLSYTQDLKEGTHPDVTISKETGDSVTISAGYLRTETPKRVFIYNLIDGGNPYNIEGAKYKLSVTGINPDDSGNTLTNFIFIIDNTPPEDLSISITGSEGSEDGYSITPKVTLTLSATDAQSGVETAIIKQGTDTEPTYWTGAIEVEYTATPRTTEFDLTGNDGLKYIWVKFRNKAGKESAPISSSITLDATKPTLVKGAVTPAENDWTNVYTIDAAWSPSDGVTDIVKYNYAFTEKATLAPEDKDPNGKIIVTGATPIEDPLITSITDEDLGLELVPDEEEKTIYLYVQAKDTAGNWGDPITYTFNIDRSLPTVSDFTPADATTVTNDEQPITAILRDEGSGIDCDSIELWIYGVNVVTNPGLGTLNKGDCEGAATPPNEATITFTPDPPWLSGVDVIINKLEFSDIAGNTYTSPQMFFGVNTDIPKVYLGENRDVEVDDDSYVSIEPLTNIIWLEFGYEPETTPTLTIDGKPPLSSPVHQTSGPKHYYKYTAASVLPDSDSPYTIRGEFTKSGSNPVDWSITFVIDNTVPESPSISITSTGSPGYSIIPEVTLTLSATEDTYDEVDQISISTDGTTDFTPVCGVDTEVDITKTTNTYSCSPTYILPGADGQKTLYAKFRNKAGSESAPADASATIILDTEGPVISDLASSTHEYPSIWYKEVTGVIFSWKAADALGSIGDYSYLINQIPNTEPDETPEIDLAAGDLTITKDLSATVAAGEYKTLYFHIKAKDSAGNWGAAQHFQFNIDRKIPELVANTWLPTGTSKIKTPAISVDIDGTGSPIDCDNIVEFKVGPSGALNTRTPTCTPITGTNKATISYNPTEDLIIGDSGIILVNLIIKDQAENQNSPSFDHTFNIDINAPDVKLSKADGVDDITIEQNDAKQLTDTSYNLIKFIFNNLATFEDSDLTIQRDSVTLTKVRQGDPVDEENIRTFNYTINTNFAEQGDYTITLNYTDSNGVVHDGTTNPNYQLSFTIDNTPPEVEAVTIDPLKSNNFISPILKISAPATDPDGSGIDKCYYTIDGGTTWLPEGGFYYDKSNAQCSISNVDTTGAYTHINIKAIDKAGNSDEGIPHLIEATDSTPPETTALISQTAVAGWYNEGVSVILTASDDETGDTQAGVDHIKYCIGTSCDPNTGTTIPGEAETILINTEGTNILRYYAVDKVGNEEETKETTIKIDTKNPKLVHASKTPSPGSTITDITPTISVILQDDTSLTQDDVSGLDSGSVVMKICSPAQVCTTTATLTPDNGMVSYTFTSGLSYGDNEVEYTVKIEAQDIAGNPTPISNIGSWKFTLNPNAPTITEWSFDPEIIIYQAQPIEKYLEEEDADVTITFQEDIKDGSVAVRLDNGVWVSDSNSDNIRDIEKVSATEYKLYTFELRDLTEVTHSLEVRATRQDNSVTTDGLIYEFKVDATDPVIGTITAPQRTSDDTPDIIIPYTEENIANISVKLGEDSPVIITQDLSSPYTLNSLLLREGDNEITIIITDKVGRESTPSQINIDYDRVPPDISIAADPLTNDETNTHTITITTGSSEADSSDKIELYVNSGSGYQLKTTLGGETLGDGTLIEGETTADVTLDTGINIIRAIAYDDLGNHQDSNEILVILDKDPPQIDYIIPGSETQGEIKLRDTENIRVKLFDSSSGPALIDSEITVKDANDVDIPGATAFGTLDYPELLVFTPEEGSEFNTRTEDIMEYNVTIHAVDAAENSEDYTRYFTLDRNAPLITFTYPTEKKTYNKTGEETQTITGTVTPIEGRAIQSLTYNIGASDETITDYDPFSVDLTLTEGETIFTITAIDDQGSEARDSIVLILDTENPEVTVTTPTTSTTKVTLRIDGTYSDKIVASDDAGYQTIEKITAQVLNGEEVITLIPAVSYVDGRFTLNADFSLGQNTIKVTAQDKAGNSQIATKIITLSAPISKPVMDEIESDGVVGPADMPLTITGTSDIGSTVELLVNRVSYGTDTIALDESTVTININGPGVLSPVQQTLTQGQKVKIKNNLGIKVELSGQFSETLNEKDEEGDESTTLDTFGLQPATYTYSATTIEASPITLQGTIVVESPSRSFSIVDIDLSKISSIGNEHVLFVRATDQDGNQEDSNSQILIYDNKRPTLTGKNPPEPSKLNTRPSVVSITLQDDVGIDWTSLVLKIREGSNQDTVLTRGTNPQDYALNTQNGLILLIDPSFHMSIPSGIEPNIYTLTIIADDLAGNQLEGSWKIEIDIKTDPYIAITNPPTLTDTIVKDQNPSFEGSITSSTGIQFTATLTINQQTYNLNLDENGHFSQITHPLPEGSNQFIIEVKDAGEEVIQSKEGTIIVNTQGPGGCITVGDITNCP